MQNLKTSFLFPIMTQGPSQQQEQTRYCVTGAFHATQKHCKEPYFSMLFNLKGRRNRLLYLHFYSASSFLIINY